MTIPSERSPISHQEAVDAYQNFGLLKSGLTKAIAIIAGIFTFGKAYDSAFTWMVSHLMDLPQKASETALKVDAQSPFKANSVMQDIKELALSGDSDKAEKILKKEGSSKSFVITGNDDKYVLSFVENVSGLRQIKHVSLNVGEEGVKTDDNQSFKDIDSMLDSFSLKRGNAVKSSLGEYLDKPKDPINEIQANAMGPSPDEVHYISAQEGADILKDRQDGEYLIRGFKGAPNQFMLGVKTDGIVNYTHFSVRDGKIRNTNTAGEFTDMDTFLRARSAKNSIHTTNTKVKEQVEDKKSSFNINALAHSNKSSTRWLVTNRPIGTCAIRRTGSNNRFSISVMSGEMHITSLNFSLSDSGKIIDENYKEYESFKDFIASLGVTTIITPVPE